MAEETNSRSVPIHADSDNWIVEQVPGGSVTIQEGLIDIRDKEGCTVWFAEKLQAPVEIRYEAQLVGGEEPELRVSDLNCFWMATDPRSPDDLFAEGHLRTGQFATYDSLETYYVGYGGNTNSTTRFRRYTGDGKRPLLPEHDLGEAPYLLKADHWYQIKLTAKDGIVTYERDGELVFRYEDDEFLESGWFGIRTVWSHLQIRNLEIESSER